MMSLFLNLMLLSSEHSQRLAKVYERYFIIISGVVARYFHEDADEAIAEIFEKKILPAVLKGRFQNEDDSGLAYTVAENYCRTIYQRKKKARNISSLDNFDDTISSTTEKELELRDFRIDFQSSLSCLSKEERMVMEKTFSGFSDKEITEKFKIRHPAVKRQRAKAKIAKFMKG